MINKAGIIASARRNLLFDIQGGAYGAYSLRYLNRDYTGDVIRGYHDGTGETQGFTPTEIVDGTLVDWADGDHVRVNYWYDQSGNGNTAIQSARYNMPPIVISGVMQFLSGTIPAVNFDGTNDFIPLDSALPDIDIGSCSSFCVGKFDAAITSGNGEYMLTLGTPTDSKRWYAPAALATSKFNWGYGGTYNIYQETQDTNPHLFGAISGATQGDWQAFLDGTSKDNQTRVTGASSGTYGIGGVNNTTSYALDGKVAEVVVYSSDQSAKRTALEKNIMDYYSIS